MIFRGRVRPGVRSVKVRFQAVDDVEVYEPAGSAGFAGMRKARQVGGGIQGNAR